MTEQEVYYIPFRKHEIEEIMHALDHRSDVKKRIQAYIDEHHLRQLW